MHRLGRLCAVICWLVCCTGVAGAQGRTEVRVVLLVPSLDGERPQREQVRAGLAREGFEVVDVRGLAGGEVLTACRAVECAPQVMTAAGAHYAVLARVDGAMLSVMLVNVHGETRSASLRWTEDDDIATVIAEASDRARLAFDLGPDARLRVHSTPVGALVSVDGALAGVAPTHLRVKPGVHRVVATLEGFEASDRSVEVRTGQVETIRLGLSRTADTGPRAAEPVLDYVVGSVLVIGALPALSISLDTLAREGDCDGRRDVQGRCSDTVYFGTQSAVLLSVGVLALGTGLYSFFATPFTADVEVSSEGASAALSGRF